MFLSTPFDKVSTKQNYCVAMFNPYVVLYKAKQLLYHTILTFSHAEQSIVRIVNAFSISLCILPWFALIGVLFNKRRFHYTGNQEVQAKSHLKYS